MSMGHNGTSRGTEAGTEAGSSQGTQLTGSSRKSGVRQYHKETQ